MKKVIMIEIFLAFATATLIAVAAWRFSDVSMRISLMDSYLSMGDIDRGNDQKAFIIKSLSYAIPSLLAALCTLAAIIIIAIKDFPVFKPFVDKFTAKRAAYKEQRAAIKVEQAEVAKQARIEQLQAELDELKKDE